MPTDIFQSEERNVIEDTYKSTELTTVDFLEFDIQVLNSDSKKNVRKEWDTCNKQNAHQNTISCTKFIKNTEKYLKKHNIINDEVLKKFILSSIALTVRLVVKQISRDRPDSYQIQYGHTGKIVTGSGIIVDIKRSNKMCKCNKHLPISKSRSWTVYIATSTHVVFDHSEAENTTADLFYHDINKKNIKELRGVQLYERSIANNFCILECETCVHDLCEHVLKPTLKEHYELRKVLPKGNDKIMVISHPHGMPKRLSFGSFQEIKTKQESIFSFKQLKYKSATCKGSTGAPVFNLNDTFEFASIISGEFAVHCGYGGNIRLNYSSLDRIPKLIPRNYGNRVCLILFHLYLNSKELIK